MSFGATQEHLGGPLWYPSDPLGVSWGGLGVILVPFWEYFGVQNGAKKHQKSDPESGHFPDHFLERFGHPGTLILEVFVWRICKNHMFHIFEILFVFGTILNSK